MARVRVATFIRAPRSVVWESVLDIGSHVDWMRDAHAIRFTSRRRAGVGTRFECETRVGPLGFTDTLEVVEWKKGRAIGIRHDGLVTGSGRFTLRRRRGGTLFSWDERLHFPFWLGGPFTGAVAARVLRVIWKGNLARLRQLIEG